MSFQDMGRSKAGGGNRSSSYSPKLQPSPAASASRGNALTQISEGLNQYQRNVGILDKIVQQLAVTQKPGGGGANANELQMQYDVQVDVVTQLEKRVEQQLNNANSSLPQIVKLKRDFQLVQTRVKTLRSDAQKLREAKFAVGSYGTSHGVNPDRSLAAQGGDGAGLQQQQLLMQQDRLAEEIMREREAEIRNINQGMHQVHEIYKDLAHIVGSQQEQIDTIEHQMEESRANAEQGLKQVEKANEKYGNSQCIIS